MPVTLIRAWPTPDDKGMDFIRHLYAQGLKLELGISPQYSSNAPQRAYQPGQFSGMWGGPPLSAEDPKLSKAYFQAFFDKLDASNIALAGVELGNEINWAAFNPEFPLPGEGKTFGYDDLTSDPEAQQIARGYVQYLKVLAILKDTRDHSRVNSHTPIVSAGLADVGPEGTHSSKEDSVSINATLRFLKANGLDRLVDAYGIHEYPGSGGTPSGRKMRLEQNAVAECSSTSGKPCWITEWGFKNNDMSCPEDDSVEVGLIEETIGNFRELVQQGRLIGAMYYVWNTAPGSSHTDPFSVYRCGAVTKSGQAALSQP